MLCDLLVLKGILDTEKILFNLSCSLSALAVPGSNAWYCCFSPDGNIYEMLPDKVVTHSA